MVENVFALTVSLGVARQCGAQLPFVIHDRDRRWFRFDGVLGHLELAQFHLRYASAPEANAPRVVENGSPEATLRVNDTSRKVEPPFTNYWDDWQIFTVSVDLAGPARPEVDVESRPVLPTLRDPEPQCRFADRCPWATGECVEQSPPPVEIDDGHTIECHYPEEAERFRREGATSDTWQDAQGNAEEMWGSTR